MKTDQNVIRTGLMAVVDTLVVLTIGGSAGATTITVKRILFTLTAVGLMFGAGSAQAANIITLDGTSGSNTINTNYTTDGDLNVDLGFFADYLIVGGGGGGGVRKQSARGAGGGGGGGLIYATGVEITSGGSVTVGAGGAGGVDIETPISGDEGDNGGDSILTVNGETLTAFGGGGGGRSYSSGLDGGSGGGAGGGRNGGNGDATQTQPPPGYGTGYGNDGGNRTGGGQYTPGAGGGGAGAAGSSSSGGGNGGAGLDFDITGETEGYAGGGGGTNTQGNSGGTASHGGGAGSTSSARDGQDGVDGGGGGASADPNGDGTGGNGGSGIVVVRYAGPAAATGGDEIFSTVDGNTVHKFTSVGTSALDLSGLDLDSRLGVTLTGVIDGNGDFNYNGPGRLTLTADNSYTGATNVNGGSLQVNGMHTGGGVYTVASGATLGGTGTSDATLGGDGLVSPGASPGILTFGQVDPSGGMDFAFQFTQTGDPTWSSAAASGNDVFRLTDGTTPITSTLTSSNEFSIYLDVASLNEGDTFRGGLFTDLDSDFSSLIEDATASIYVLGDGNGTDTTFDSQDYYSLENYNVALGSDLLVDISATQVSSADFAGGTVNDGWVMQFDVPAIVPEPSAICLWSVLGLTLVGYGCYRRRQKR